MPAELRQRFFQLVAEHAPGCVKRLGEVEGQAQAQSVAWRITARLDAWRRRGVDDFRPCGRGCGVDVLWHTEEGRRVPFEETGYLHVCRVQR